MTTNENVLCANDKAVATDAEKDFGNASVAQKIKYAFWKGVGCGVAVCIAIALLVEILD